jgi:hypothetical protein
VQFRTGDLSLVTAESGISLPVGSTSFTDEEFTPGAELEFTVALPVGITQGNDVSIHAHSRVLRAEERREDDTTHTGVAAVIEGIESIRAEPALS